MKNEKFHRFCFFCCKQIENFKPPCKLTRNQHEKFSAQFFTYLDRHFGAVALPILLGFGDQRSGVATCQNCEPVLESFCDYYHQMKCQELQVQWRTHTIMRIMQEAGRVPSRIRLLKEELGGDDDQKNEIRHQGDLKRNHVNFMKIREEVIQICARGLSSFLPKVQLKKERMQTSYVEFHSQTHSSSECQLFLRNWIVSFAAIVMLLSILPNLSSDSSHHNNSQKVICDSFLSDERDDGTYISSKGQRHPDAIPVSTSTYRREDPNKMMDTDYNLRNSPDLTKIHCLQETLSKSEESSEDEGRLDGYENTSIKIETENGNLNGILKQEVGTECTEPVNDKHQKVSSMIAEDLQMKDNCPPNVFQCSFCPKHFSKKTLNAHVRRCHPQLKKECPRQGTFVCKICNRYYYAYHGYLSHSKSLMHRNKMARLRRDPQDDSGAHKSKQIPVQDTAPVMKSTYNENLDDSLPGKRRYNLRAKVIPTIKTLNTGIQDEEMESSDGEDKYSAESDMESTDDSDTSFSSSQSGDESVHDITKVDPDKIINCEEKNCSAHFTREQVCQVHGTEFLRTEPSEYHPQVHKYLLHKKGSSPDSEVVVNKIHYSRFICPVEECSERFKLIEVLEQHQKLHGRFKCQFCEDIKDYAPELALHELEHHTEPSEHFKCSRCSYISKLKTSSSYVTHFLEAHLLLTDRLYECNNCHERFKSRQKHDIHLKTHHQTSNGDNSPEIIKNCTSCTAFFLDDKQLEKHENFCLKPPILNPKTGRRIQRQKFTCQVQNCKESFKSFKSLEEHKNLHGDFKCQFCSVRKGYAEDLVKHEMKEHSKPDKKARENECPRCSYYALRRGSLVGHYFKKHLGLDVKPYSCTICKLSFFAERSLRGHMANCHKTEGIDPTKIERCDQCPAYFLKKIQVVNHRREVHLGVDYRLKKCYKCGKSFKYRDSLRQHLKNIHGLGKSGDDFEFACDLPNCTKRFKTKDDLDRHQVFGSHKMTINNSEKIICQECGKLFVKRAMGLHMRAHRKYMPIEFKCEQCGKTFNQNTKLQTHLKFHEGPEKWEFMCAICSKKCFSKNKLLEHMRTHTKEKPFVCQVCGEKYAHRHNLRNHVNSKHKDEGVQDLPVRVFKNRFHVSRKGKKLGKNFCFTRDQN